MIGPEITERVEKSDNPCRVRVYCGQVWALSQIAMLTSQRQIRGIIGPTVLPRYDVFDMIPVKRFIILSNMAIFAPLARAMPNQIT